MQYPKLRLLFAGTGDSPARPPMDLSSEDETEDEAVNADVANVGYDANDNDIIGYSEQFGDPRDELWFCLDCEECMSKHCEHNTHPRR